MQPEHKNNLAFRIIAACLAVLVVLGIAIPTFLGISLKDLLAQWMGQPVYTHTKDPYSYLMRENPSFSQAETVRRNGDATSSIELYKLALVDAPDKVQRDQITYKIGLAELARRNEFEAIRIFKGIAADTTATNIVRAYSVQAIAFIWHREPAKFNDAIFTEQPYASLYHADSVDLTQRDIFGYAADLFPIALSELQVADWYGTQLEVDARGRGKKLTSDEKAQYVAEVQRRIALADSSFERTKDDPNLTVYVPDTFLAHASIERNLVVAGVSSPDKADGYYKLALQAYSVLKGPPQDGEVRFQYARFLLQVYGDKRLSDIHAVLEPMYATDAYKNTHAFVYFSGEKNNKHGKKIYLAALAQKDAGFKKLLMRLGWKSTDFATVAQY